MLGRTTTALYSARCRRFRFGPRCAEAEGTLRSPGAAPRVQLQIVCGSLLRTGRAIPPRVHAIPLEHDDARRSSRYVRDDAERTRHRPTWLESSTHPEGSAVRNPGARGTFWFPEYLACRYRHRF